MHVVATVAALAWDCCHESPAWQCPAALTTQVPWFPRCWYVPYCRGFFAWHDVVTRRLPLQGSMLSGMLARIPCHPLDTCKSRLQVQDFSPRSCPGKSCRHGANHTCTAGTRWKTCVCQRWQAVQERFRCSSKNCPVRRAAGLVPWLWRCIHRLCACIMSVFHFVRGA